MHHIHLDQTESTQTHLKNILQQYPQMSLLVSTDHQTQGKGRQGSDWLHLDQAIAFSFTLTPNQELTLSPLEVGVLLCEFFRPRLQIKWPNDLLNSKKQKCGGIICQLVGKTIVVGVGLNLKKSTKEEPSFPYPVGPVLSKEDQLDHDYKSSLPKKLYEFILNNRLSPNQVCEAFEKNCAHINQEVVIINNTTQDEGLFTGISPRGEALLKGKEGQKNIMTGSLRWKD